MSSNRNKVHDKFGIMYFENQVVLSLRLYDKEIITLVSLGIGSIMYWE